jgi:DHA2 family methylenomycin A resistance protein-like MFS transporter
VQTGLAFLPMTLPMAVMPLFAGRLVARFGARPVVLTGLGADVVCGALLVASGDKAVLGWVLAAQLALAAGSTLAIPGATADMSTAAPAHLAGTGQGILNAGRQAGAALGVAVLGTLASLRDAGLVLGVAAVISVLAVLAVQQKSG